MSYDTLAADTMIGSRGATVQEIQHSLMSRGYQPGAMDGVYGPKTKEAVQRFQSDMGLVIDGIVGTKTWQALMVAPLDRQAPVPSPAPVNSPIPSVLPSRSSGGFFSSFTLSLPMVGLAALTVFLAMGRKVRHRARRRKR